jgi:2'-hydroxyisoflavone reductase
LNPYRKFSHHSQALEVRRGKMSSVRMLVLGGTRFVGYAVLSAAIRAGWEVTSFSRGVSGSPPAGARVVCGDRLNRGDLEQLAAAGPWDAVVDTSGFVPRDVLMACEYLRPVTAHYLFVSTVSVYRGWPREPLSESSEVLFCPPDAGPDYGEDVEDGPTKYGYQKSGCELAVATSFGHGHYTILRPGVILGPREYVGRLPWWLLRVAAGGRVLAPGDPARFIQPVDVRDLADFALLAMDGAVPGTYNIAAPQNRETFGQMLQACAEVTGSDAEFTWVSDAELLAAGVRQWSQLPLWRTFPGVWQVDSTKAQAAGLSCREITDTVADTWAWMNSGTSEFTDQRSAEIGIGSDLERQILSQHSGK